MSKAADLANLIGNINAGGGGVNRNLIINGNMSCSQRGTVTDASGEYTLDRFRFNKTNLDELAVTVSQVSDSPSGFSNSMKVDVTTAESSIANDERSSIEQRIEAQNLQHLLYGSSDAKTCTLSFFVKSSVAGKYGINIRHHDASQSKGLDYTINSADTWERKEINFTGFTPTAINNDNGIGLWIRWMLIVGTDWQNTAVENQWNASGNGYYVTTGMQSTWGTSTDHNFYLTGVQLEIGENATTFEHEPFERTYLKCQRYFQKSYRYEDYLATNTGNGCVGYYATSDADNMNITWAIPMRASPDMSIQRKNGGGANQAQRGNNNATYANLSSIVAVATGLEFQQDATNDAHFRFHYYADAEL